MQFAEVPAAETKRLAVGVLNRNRGQGHDTVACEPRGSSVAERFVDHICGHARYGAYGGDGRQTGMRRFRGRSSPMHSSLFNRPVISASLIYLQLPAVPVAYSNGRDPWA